MTLKPSESRRGFLRVDFDAGTQVTLRTDAGDARFDALDVSVYGLSFLVPADEAGRFAQDSVIECLEFMIHGRQIRVKGRVAHVQQDQAGGRAKVAIEFTGIQGEDVWALSGFVAEKAGVKAPLQIAVPRSTRRGEGKLGPSKDRSPKRKR